MAGISYLYEEYKKDPERIEKLLDEEIEITEKLDGSRFLVQVAEGGTFIYFKRKDMSISKIDRALSKYYEKAINHFENFNEEKISQIPEGWRFGMEYFPNLQPVTITYDRLPLNNLVLTDIQVKDPRDKTIDIITDKETLSKWADILEIENPPIVYEGKLNISQKNKILDFLNTPYESLVKRFKTENFTNFILKLLNPEMKNSFLGDSTEKDIEGLVFKFGGKESFRVSNPEVVLSKVKKNEEKPSDIYNLTLVILQEFLTSLDFKKIKLKEKTYEDRYIEFISRVFNLFVKSSQYKSNFERGIDFELPKFLSRAESNMNFKFVKDPETLSALEKSNTNRELFKILLASMRSHKKKSRGFFSKELIYHHNTLVDKIVDYVGAAKEATLKEANLVSFQEFKRVFLTESENWQEEFGKESAEEIEAYVPDVPLEPEVKLVYEDSSDISTVDFPSYIVTKTKEEEPKVIEVLKKIAAPVEKSSEKKKKAVCLLMGKFQPFHNGHSTVIEDAATSSGCKVFIAVTTKRLAENGISRELHHQMLKDVLDSNNKVSGIIFTDGRSVAEIVRDLPGYDVQAFAGSEEECEDIRSQIPEIKVFPMTKHLTSNTVFQKIKNEDYDGYRKLVPKALHNYFYKIKNEMHDQ